MTAVLAREAEETAALDSGSGLQLNPLRDEPNKSGKRAFHFHYGCELVLFTFALSTFEPNTTLVTFVERDFFFLQAKDNDNMKHFQPLNECNFL